MPSAVLNMHELSVALKLLEMAEERCRAEGCQAVDSVKVRVGKASGILPEAFRFAFEAAKQGTLAGEATLIVDVVPLGGFCPKCQNHFTTKEAYLLECPSCSSSRFKINQGYELELIELELN